MKEFNQHGRRLKHLLEIHHEKLQELVGIRAYLETNDLAVLAGPLKQVEDRMRQLYESWNNSLDNSSNFI